MNALMSSRNIFHGAVEISGKKVPKRSTPISICAEWFDDRSPELFWWEMRVIAESSLIILRATRWACQILSRKPVGRACRRGRSSVTAGVDIGRQDDHVGAEPDFRDISGPSYCRKNEVLCNSGTRINWTQRVHIVIRKRYGCKYSDERRGIY